VIVADYALSQERMDDIVDRLNASEGYERVWDELPPDTLHARPETMRELLAEVREQWGSMEGYAAEVGFDAAAVRRLREVCLEPR